MMRLSQVRFRHAANNSVPGYLINAVTKGNEIAIYINSLRDDDSFAVLRFPARMADTYSAMLASLDKQYSALAWERSERMMKSGNHVYMPLMRGAWVA